DSLSFTDAIAAIQAALVASPIYGDENKRAFAPVDQALGALQGKAAPPEDAVANVFEALTSSLRDAAGSKRVLLGLDHINSIEYAHWGFTRDHFVAPVRSGTLPVHLLIVGGAGDDPRLVDLAAASITVPSIPESEFREHARRFLRALGYASESFTSVIDEM